MSYFDDYKKQMEIDYYVYFSKTYFAFNHYLKNEFPKYNDDRTRIDEIKNLKSLSKNSKNCFKKMLLSFQACCICTKF